MDSQDVRFRHLRGPPHSPVSSQPPNRCRIAQTADCLISAYARRKCHIADSDLPTYFAHADTKIILPRLPMDSLLPIAQKLVKAISSRESALKSAKHLLACWVCACQRAFVQFAAREYTKFRLNRIELTNFPSW